MSAVLALRDLGLRASEGKTAESACEIAREVLAGCDRTAVNERWHVRKDGTRFFASGFTQALVNGGRRGVLAMTVILAQLQFHVSDPARPGRRAIPVPATPSPSP